MGSVAESRPELGSGLAAGRSNCSLFYSLFDLIVCYYKSGSISISSRLRCRLYEIIDLIDPLPRPHPELLFFSLSVATNPYPLSLPCRCLPVPIGVAGRHNPHRGGAGARGIALRHQPQLWRCLPPCGRGACVRAVWHLLLLFLLVLLLLLLPPEW